jgi:hypothetical protein
MIAEYLQHSAALHQDHGTRGLGDGLQLEGIQFSPNPVTAGGALGFTITVRAQGQTSIHDLHVVLNDPTGFRIAMLDLRDPKGPYVLKPGEAVVFAGAIARLPLVAGTYGVGIVVRTVRDHEEYQDLFHLEVGAPPPRAGLMPYATRYQGTTVLDYTFEGRVTRAGRPK